MFSKSILFSNTGVKTTFYQEFDDWKMWICEKWDFENVNFVKKWHFENVNSAKSDVYKMWIFG